MNKHVRSIVEMLLVTLLSFWSASESVARVLKDSGNSGLRKSGFPIRESGYWTCERLRTHCIYWMDNDRIMFNGVKRGDFEVTSEGRNVPRHAIYVWDLRSGVVTKYADAAKGSLCFVDGYIRYRRIEGDEAVVMAGLLGRENEVERRKRSERGEPDPEESGWNRQEWGWNTDLSCYKHRPPHLEPLAGLKIALKEGHGFLYVGTRDSADDRRKPIVYFTEKAAQIRLPAMRWQISTSSIRRSEFDNSYVFWGRAEPDWNDACLRPGAERKIFRLTPDGRTEEISIPANEEVRCHVNYFALVRTGVVVQSGAGHVRNLDLSRLFLLQDGRIKEVARGTVSDQSVSPDGCRMAVGISSNDDPGKPRAALNAGHLKVIDFCAKGER